MNMLNENQIEIIHREADGENTPAESAQVRELVEAQPEAMALLTSLRELDTMFGRVPERAPSASLKSSLRSVVSPRPIPQQQTQKVNRWAAQQWSGISNFMGELMSTKKLMLGATTAVALIAIIGYAIVGYPPSGNDAGTIGGVQKADRYRGRTLTEKDVTLSNPEIKALFQNDAVLKLVKSSEFRAALNNDAFHDLLNNEAYHDLQKNEVFMDIMDNDASHDLFNNEAFHDLLNNDAFHDILNNDVAKIDVNKGEVLHDLQNNEALHDILNTEAGHDLLNNDAFHDLLNNEAGHDLLNNDSFHDIMNNDAFHDIMNNDALHDLLNNDALHDLLSAEVFQNVLHDASLTEVFLNEANRYY